MVPSSPTAAGDAQAAFHQRVRPAVRRATTGASWDGRAGRGVGSSSAEGPAKGDPKSQAFGILRGIYIVPNVFGEGSVTCPLVG